MATLFRKIDRPVVRGHMTSTQGSTISSITKLFINSCKSSNGGRSTSSGMLKRHPKNTFYSVLTGQRQNNPDRKKQDKNADTIRTPDKHQTALSGYSGKSDKGRVPLSSGLIKSDLSFEIVRWALSPVRPLELAPIHPKNPDYNTVLQSPGHWYIGIGFLPWEKFKNVKIRNFIFSF